MANNGRGSNVSSHINKAYKAQTYRDNMKHKASELEHGGAFSEGIPDWDNITKTKSDSNKYFRYDFVRSVAFWGYVIGAATIIAVILAVLFW